VPHKYEIEPSETSGLLKCHDISGGLNNAQQGVIPTRIGAQLTELELCKISAGFTAAHTFKRLRQCPRQSFCPLPIAL